MPEIGQSSHAIEEEEIREIPVDTEQLIGYAPVAPVQSESEEDEDEVDEAEEAETDGSEEAAEADPEEMETEPIGYHDDMGTTADDLIEELTTHNVQLEERVALLEEQNTVHQEMENQYKSEAHGLKLEVNELKAQIQRLESVAPHLGPTVQQLMLQNSQLKQALERSQNQGVEMQTVLQAVKAERDWERAYRVRAREFWVRAATRVDVLEREARDRPARIRTLENAMNTASHQLRDRVRRYPQEEGSSRRMISRRAVDRMARQAFRRAVRSGRR